MSYVSPKIFAGSCIVEWSISNSYTIASQQSSYVTLNLYASTNGTEDIVSPYNVTIYNPSYTDAFSWNFEVRLSLSLRMLPYTRHSAKQLFGFEDSALEICKMSKGQCIVSFFPSADENCTKAHSANFHSIFVGLLCYRGHYIWGDAGKQCLLANPSGRREEYLQSRW